MNQHDLQIGWHIFSTKIMFFSNMGSEFITWCSFLKWKEEEESATFILFSQPKGEILDLSGKVNVPIMGQRVYFSDIQAKHPSCNPQ